jgi:hypothetical protein
MIPKSGNRFSDKIMRKEKGPSGMRPGTQRKNHLCNTNGNAA